MNKAKPENKKESKFTPYCINEDRGVTEAERKEFEEMYKIAENAQMTYGEIVLRLMEKLDISIKEAAEKTGLPESAFNNLLDPEKTSIPKRYVVSIAVGFGLNLHLAEYLLEAASMKFNTNDFTDCAYAYIIQNHAKEPIEDCNAILKGLGVSGDKLLGELMRCGGVYNKSKTNK